MLHLDCQVYNELHCEAASMSNDHKEKDNFNLIKCHLSSSIFLCNEEITMNSSVKEQELVNGIWGWNIDQITFIGNKFRPRSGANGGCICFRFIGWSVLLYCIHKSVGYFVKLHLILRRLGYKYLAVEFWLYKLYVPYVSILAVMLFGLLNQFQYSSSRARIRHLGNGNQRRARVQ